MFNHLLFNRKFASHKNDKTSSNIINPCYPKYSTAHKVNNKITNYEICSHKFYTSNVKYVEKIYGDYNETECYELLEKVIKFNHINENDKQDSPFDLKSVWMSGIYDKENVCLPIIYKYNNRQIFFHKKYF